MLNLVSRSCVSIMPVVRSLLFNLLPIWHEYFQLVEAAEEDAFAKVLLRLVDVLSLHWAQKDTLSLHTSVHRFHFRLQPHA